jgi:hypothetical protein
VNKKANRENLIVTVLSLKIIQEKGEIHEKQDARIF